MKILMVTIKQCGLLGLLFVLSCTVLLGVFSSTANAASPYDYLVKTGDTLEYGSTSLGYTNVSLNWVSLIDTCDPSYKISIQNAFDTGSWSVTNYVQGQYKSIFITWIENDLSGQFPEFYEWYGTSYYGFDKNYGQLHPAVKTAVIDFRGNVSCAPLDDMIYSNNILEGGSPETHIFLSTYPVIYPDGYQGNLIPETAGPQEGDLKYEHQPQFSMTVDTQGLMNLKYIPSSIEIKEGVSISIHESDSSCNSGNIEGLYTYDKYNDVDLSVVLEKKGWYTVSAASSNTKIKTWRSCFNYTGQEINIAGGNCIQGETSMTCKEVNIEDIYNACINSEIPFIHFNSCRQAFGKIVEGLSFGSIKPLSQFKFESTSQCRELQTLGDWIGIENKTVCPAVPNYVRSVITPFVSFGLSITILGYILTKSRTDFN